METMTFLVQVAGWREFLLREAGNSVISTSTN
jgi:hypothetical protein